MTGPHVFYNREDLWPNFRTAMIKSLGKQGDRGLAAV
jgi:hypothetical protein